MGKGSRPRARLITSAEEGLRWDLFLGRITKPTYLRRFSVLKKNGQIERNGKVLK